MTMSLDLPTEHLHEPVISCDTALLCLARLGVCSRDDPEIEAFRRRTVLDGNTLPASRLIELVGEFGAQAKCTRLDWNGLTNSELGYPILVFLKNANTVVVTGTDSAAANAVSVWDPLHSDDEVLSVQQEDFERAWSGDALVIARQPSTAAEASPGPSREQNIEILEPGPEQGGKQAPIAEEPLLPGSVPAARRAKSRRLAAIGLVAAAGIGIALWTHGVTYNVGPAETKAKEAIPELPLSALWTAEAAVHGVAPGAAASASVGPMPQAVPSTEMPGPTELMGGPAAALEPATETPMLLHSPDITKPAPVEKSTEPVLAAVPVEATPSANNAGLPLPVDPLRVEARLSAAETAALLARGDSLFSTGDLAAARLFYEHAADAGEAQAAVRLGETFDPIFLDHAHLRGVPGNVETALSWYRRARDLGAAEAEILLNSLQAK